MNISDAPREGDLLRWSQVLIMQDHDMMAKPFRVQSVGRSIIAIGEVYAADFRAEGTG